MLSCAAGGNVALVKIEGTIISPDKAIDQLEDARKDPAIKAVVVRIDSPGGSVGASQEIFEELKEIDKLKPVVVSMGDVAASGGYYISCGARKVFANLGTVTGSIGVRMEHMNIKELLNWAKISHETLKSGNFKDIGNPDRPLTPEERELLQELLASMHKQFKEAVSKARKIPMEKVNKIADGRVYTGEQAKELGLVDEIGGLLAAVRFAGKDAGIKGEPMLKKYESEKPWWYKILFEESLDNILSRINVRRFS